MTKEWKLWQKKVNGEEIKPKLQRRVVINHTPKQACLLRVQTVAIP